MFHKILKCLTCLALTFSASLGHGALILSFNSSPTSWVGQGKSFTVTPQDGYLFNVSPLWGNSVGVLVASLNSPFGPLWNPASGAEYHYWNLELAAPNGAALVPGLYENAARWPFQNVSQPGMTFSGDHRGNNQLSGFFNVLEIGFDSSNALSKIAVDFTQYDERALHAWVTGSLRFNSDVPIHISEPASFALLLPGLLVLTGVRRAQTLRKKHGD